MICKYAYRLYFLLIVIIHRYCFNLASAIHFIFPQHGDRFQSFYQQNGVFFVGSMFVVFLQISIYFLIDSKISLH